MRRPFDLHQTLNTQATQILAFDTPVWWHEKEHGTYKPRSSSLYAYFHSVNYKLSRDYWDGADRILSICATSWAKSAGSFIVWNEERYRQNGILQVRSYGSDYEKLFDSREEALAFAMKLHIRQMSQDIQYGRGHLYPFCFFSSKDRDTWVEGPVQPPAPPAQMELFE